MGFKTTSKKLVLMDIEFANENFINDIKSVEFSEDELETIIRMYKYIKDIEITVPLLMEKLVRKVKKVLK